MSGGVFFKLGQGWGRLPLAGKITAGLVVLFGLSRCGSSDAPSPPATPTAAKAVVDPEAAARVLALKEKAIAACNSKLAESKAQYETLMRDRKYLEAKAALGTCPAVLGDKELLALADRAQRLDLETAAQDSKAPAVRRLAAIESLKKFDPDAAKRFEPLIPQLEKSEAREAADAEKRQKAAIAAEKRNKGVSIGMTPEDAIASSWGKPERINKTTTQFGTREQWVYGGRNYLYFENGKLTSIQN